MGMQRNEKSENEKNERKLLFSLVPLLAISLLVLVAGCISIENGKAIIKFGGADGESQVSPQEGQLEEEGSIESAFSRRGKLDTKDVIFDMDGKKIIATLVSDEVIFNTSKGNVSFMGEPTIEVGECSGLSVDMFLDSRNGGSEPISLENCEVSNRGECNILSMENYGEFINLIASCPTMPWKDRVGWIKISATLEYVENENYTENRSPTSTCAEVEDGKHVCEIGLEGMWAKR